MEKSFVMSCTNCSNRYYCNNYSIFNVGFHTSYGCKDFNLNMEKYERYEKCKDNLTFKEFVNALYPIH
jgi:hypothetical protein